MKNWIDIEYEYHGERAKCAELGHETAICRLESLTMSGAKILKVEEQRSTEKMNCKRKEDNMLKYYKYPRPYNPDTREEITKNEALRILLGTFKDCDMTHDLLTVVNRIECMYSTVEVEKVDENGRHMVLMAGLANELPRDVEYDDNGNRI